MKTDPARLSYQDRCMAVHVPENVSSKEMERLIKLADYFRSIFGELLVQAKADEKAAAEREDQIVQAFINRECSTGCA